MGKENPNWGKERRQGLRAALGLTTEPFFRGFFGEIVPQNGLNNVEIVKTFPYPHPDLALVNSSIIPDEYGIHHPEERILHTINYGELSMGIYGPGIIEAIRRGQKVTLTIEQPYGLNRVRTSDWIRYIEQIAKIYQPTQFIVGNETNVDPNYLPPEDYLHYYLTAQETIGKISPNTEVLPAAEAYCGQAEYFDELLSLGDRLGIKISALPFHFYGYPEELPQRIELLREICRRHHYPDTRLVVSEMSRPENETFNEEELADFIFQVHLISAQLLGTGMEFSAWFSAFDFGRGNGHTLFVNQADGISPRPAFAAYLLASRLLYKSILQETDDALTVTHSQTADGIPILSLWNQGSEPLLRRVPCTHFAFDSLGNNLGRDLVLTPTKKIPRVAIIVPKEALGLLGKNTPF